MKDEKEFEFDNLPDSQFDDFDFGNGPNNDIDNKELISRKIIDYIGRSEFGVSYISKDDLAFLIEDYLEFYGVIKLPLGRYHFLPETFQSTVKEQTKLLLWVNHKVLKSKLINHDAKIKISFVINNTLALMAFGNIEWQFLTV